MLRAGYCSICINLFDFVCTLVCLTCAQVYIYAYSTYTSSTAQGGGGSFKNRKPIGEVSCCESRMAERIH